MVPLAIKNKFVMLKRFYRFAFLLGVFLVGCQPLMAAGKKDTSDVYMKVQHLNEGLVTLLRRNFGHNQDIRVEERLLQSEIRPRHVFQRALDVENKLLALMRLNGMDIEATRTIQIQPYSPNQVFKLLERLDVHVQELLSFHGMQAGGLKKASGNQKNKDVFHLLARMEKFLLKMGAPATQPAHVLKRARAIALISSHLCTIERCRYITRHIPSEDEFITPLHVYQETYRFIAGLDQYVRKNRIFLDGGVLALPVEQSLIQPSHVNNIMGVVLADLISIMNHRRAMTFFDFPPIWSNVMPRDVWMEINYARRLLDTMVEN